MFAESWAQGNGMFSRADSAESMKDMTLDVTSLAPQTAHVPV